MASTATNQDDNGDTVLSILKDIRELLRHQEERIKRLEDDHTPTPPENSPKLSKAENGKQLDGQPPGNGDVDEIGGSAQPPEDQTDTRLSLPSQRRDEDASTSSSGLPQPQSNSGQQETMSTPAKPLASKQINPGSPTVQEVSGLPPFDPDVNAILPMPSISWLSKIPDDKRLKFGFPSGSLASLLQPEITQGRWELDISEKHLEYRLIYGIHTLPDADPIMKAFWRFRKLKPGFGTQFFVRDNDLNGNNRLYQPSIILEYRDDLPDKPDRFEIWPFQYIDGGQKSTWDQYGQAVPPVRVPSNGKNEGNEHQDVSKWRRIVGFRGIESVLIPAYCPYQGHSDLDLLFTDTGGFILNHLKGAQSWDDRPYNGLLYLQLCGYKMYDSYVYEHIPPFYDQDIPDHEISKNQLVTQEEEYVPRIEYHRWKSGKMYEFEGHQLTKHVYSVAGVYPEVGWEDRHRKELDNAQYWTILYARPADNILDRAHDPMEELVIGMLPSLPLILQTSCLSGIREDYEELLDKIESNLGDRDSILSPDNHGKLLIDDQSFERSRRYFWTIDALDTFSGTLEESIEKFEQFTNAIRERSKHISDIARGLSDNDKDGHLIWDGVGIEVVKARRLLERIKVIKERTITLRDGLFNASSVFESRASTRLGETVKLLTYVTIFYLPLAFCATLWAVPDNFGGMHIFAIVITTVSLATYFVVFNLNHLTFYLVTLHHQIRDPLANRMNSEHDKGGKPSPWAGYGRRFQRWKPGQPDPAPSEWLILWYGFFCVARAVGVIRVAGLTARAARFLKDTVGKFNRRRERRGNVGGDLE